MTPGQTRRSVLASAAAGAAAGLAGCTSALVPGSDQRGPGLPAASVLGLDDLPPLWTRVRTATVAGRRSDFDLATYERQQYLFLPVLSRLRSVRFAQLDEIVSAWQAVTVMTGRIDQDAVAYDLHEKGFERRARSDGPDRWVAPEMDAAAALEEGHLVLAGESFLVSDVDAQTLVDGVLAAREGDADRYVPTNDDAELLVARLGDGEFVRAFTFHPPEETDLEEGLVAGHRGGGTRKRIEDSELAVTHVSLFTEGADPDPATVERWLRGSGDYPFWFPGEAAVDTTARRRGQTVEVTWSVPLDGGR